MYYVFVYQGSDGKYYTFRSVGEGKTLVSQMGEVIIEKKHESAQAATILAQLEAEKLNLQVSGL